MITFFTECTQAMQSPPPLNENFCGYNHSKRTYFLKGVNPIALDALVRKKVTTGYCLYTITKVCEWTFSDQVALNKVVTCFEYKLNGTVIEKKKITLPEVQNGTVFVNSNILFRDRFAPWRGFSLFNAFKEVMCETAPRVADLNAMHWQFEEATEYSYSELAYVVMLLRERGFQVFGNHAATRIEHPDVFTYSRVHRQGFCVKFPTNLESAQPNEHSFSAASLYSLSKRVTDKSSFEREQSPKSLIEFQHDVKKLYAGGFANYGVVDITRYKKEELAEFLKDCQSVFLGEPYIIVNELGLGKSRTYFYSQDLTLILTNKEKT